MDLGPLALVALVIVVALIARQRAGRPSDDTRDMSGDAALLLGAGMLLDHGHDQGRDHHDVGAGDQLGGGDSL